MTDQHLDQLCQLVLGTSSEPGPLLDIVSAREECEELRHESSQLCLESGKQHQADLPDP